MAGEYERICSSQGGRLNLHSRTRRGKESSLAEFPPARRATAHGFEHAGPHGDRRVSCWVTLFGLRFRGKQRTLKDYFLADNTIPWWAISLSIVAAETSTLTIISAPGLAYEKDFRFLQLVVGYMAGRIFVSALFIPQYFRGQLVTAYQLIECRFGQRLRSLTAGLFLVTRAAAEGVRVFAVAIVLPVALAGVLTRLSDYGREVAAIAIVTVLTLLYTFEGGMAAVIWTDVVQLTIYLTGTLVAVFAILHLVPGGWETVRTIAGPAGKFRMFYTS